MIHFRRPAGQTAMRVLVPEKRRRRCDSRLVAAAIEWILERASRETNAEDTEKAEFTPHQQQSLIHNDLTFSSTIP
jgi:hypothetical protein